MTSLDGIRSHFMFCVTPTGKIAMRWLSCYNKCCVDEDWHNEKTAMDATGCINRDVCGRWKVFDMVTTDQHSYTSRMSI